MCRGMRSVLNYLFGSVVNQWIRRHMQVSMNERVSPQAASSVHTSDYWLLLVTSFLVFFDTRNTVFLCVFFNHSGHKWKYARQGTLTSW